MRFGNLVRPLVAAAVFAAGAGAMSAAWAGEPAVSVLNFKVTAEGGRAQDEEAWLGVASVTAPLGDAWGVQGEAGVFSVSGDPVYGLAAHAFTRDPSRYLLGGFGAYSHFDKFGIDAGRIGVEGEYYLEHLSFVVNGGYQFGDGFVHDTGFGEAEIKWYASDDFAIEGGAAFDKDIEVTEFGAEWLIGRGSSLPGLALRGDVKIGDNDYNSATGGITYYFGPDASLKDRHRRQDPESALLDLLHGVEASCERTVQQQQFFGKVLPLSLPPVVTLNCGQQPVYLPPT